MSRWEPDARARLERAALELFTEQGFAGTTVPQITARAGLTTRTYFRHFADKREVLFAAEADLPGRVASVLDEVPEAANPLEAIASGLDRVASTVFAGLHGYLRTRRAVIRSDEGLRERELRKRAVLAEAARRGFLERGLDEPAAAIGGQLTATVLDVALDRWLDSDGATPMNAFVAEALASLRSVTDAASTVAR